MADDLRLQFRLHDTDEIVGRNPVRLDLTAVTDEPPQVGLQLAGIGTAITRKRGCRLPAKSAMTMASSGSGGSTRLTGRAGTSGVPFNMEAQGYSASESRQGAAGGTRFEGASRRGLRLGPTRTADERRGKN